jgi:tetratricopeptide (TPR) repeat protein/TolB-like protein
MPSQSWSPDAFEAGGSGSPMIGRRIGRFRITGRLGQGGIASVWKAHDDLLGRPVALKILDEKLAESPKVRRRFLHEAQTTALLDHPGVITVYDAGEAEGMTYLALSLIEGETLTERAARSLLPIDEAIRIVCDAADALGHAHARVVFHRDVTGRNIMIGRDGRVVVLDFGLALAAGLSRLTSSNAAMGTAAYMAPEMVAGADGDARTDLYGLGVVLYEALTGAYPFVGERPELVVFAALHESPRPPRVCRPEIPETLERIVLRAIARRPEDRYASAEAFIADLRAVNVASEERLVAAPKVTPVRVDEARDRSGPRDEADFTRPHPLYLAVMPFQLLEAASDKEASLAPVAERLAGTVSAALGRYSNVRVVPAGRDTTVEKPGSAQELATQLGANAILRGTVSHSGSLARVTFSILDPWRNVQLGGDVVDGSVLQLYDLEDAVVKGVARVLQLPVAASDVSSPAPPDPAAEEKLAQAVVYLRRHDHEPSVDGAIAILDHLIAAREDSAILQATLARACLLKLRLTAQRVWEARAAAAGARAAQLDPEAPEVLVALGDLHAHAGRSEEAIAEYQRAIDARPDLAEAWLGLARALDSLGRFEEALESAQSAVARWPGDWRMSSIMAKTCFDSGDFNGALAASHRVVELAPDNARGHSNVGTALFRLDRFEEAIEAYHRSLALQPSSLAWSNLGNALYFLDRREEALAAFRKAADLTPTDPRWWGNLGAAARWIPGHEAESPPALDRAILLMRERLDRAPRDGFGWARLAMWLMDRGAAAEAMQAIARAFELAPRDPQVMVRAAHVFHRAGDPAAALRWIREAVRLGYGVGEILRDPDFASLRDDPEFASLLHRDSTTPPAS